MIQPFACHFITNPRKIIEKSKIPLGFSGTHSSQEVLKLKDFCLSYGELCLFDQAELLVWEKEKLCLIGDNGTEKTALMKSVLGQSNDFSGVVSLAENTQVGYIPQKIRFPYDTDTILEAFTREHPCHEGEARNLLANRIVEVKSHLLNSFYGNYNDYRAFVLANEGK